MLAGLVSVDWQRIDRPVPMKSFPLLRENLTEWTKIFMPTTTKLLSVLEALEHQCIWEYFQPIVPRSNETGENISGVHI